jgi:hypothetical protein
MAKGEPHPLTGHLPPDRPHWGGEPLATGHTPPGATLWPKGAPPLRPHRGGGPSPTGHLWPPPPPLAREADGPHREKGSHALTGPPLATYWPSTGHPGRPLTGPPLAKRGREGATSPGPPPTDHLRPTWPSEAFGHLPPTPADRGLRTGGLPTPRLTHWPKGGLATYAPTGHPGTPPLPPAFRGAVA